MNKNKLANNVILSIIAQIISMSVSLILNLIVPKFISELTYANWQTYLLYSSYVGLLHFGLLDGIVLRYSKFDYDQLDKEIIRSQFKSLLFVSCILSISLSFINCFLFRDKNLIIFVLVSVSILIKNLYTYTSYTFQITNRINKYAYFIILDRTIYAIFVIILLIYKNDSFMCYCIADLLSDLMAIIVASFFNKGLYFGRSLKFKAAVLETKRNICSGCKLLIANWSASFLVGSSKMVVQWHWNELTFGKVSFAYSLSNLILQFVNAISVVLFPSLKRTDEKELPNLYIKIRNLITPFMFFAILFYFPMVWLLSMWLPTYTSSLGYLGVLFPMVIYTSKVSLLTNNYFKVYRKEKLMLIINVIFVIVSFMSFIIFAYLLNSIIGLLIDTVFFLMLRSIVSEYCISKIIHHSYIMDFILEAIMTVVFLMCSIFLELKWGFAIYLFSVVFYILLCRKHNRILE